MAGTIAERTLPGVPADSIRDYEIRHRAIARRAAADGMVLLRNKGDLLPLDPVQPVALYGAGAVITVKGGTGSGDVNARETVSIRDGLERAGYTLTTQEWLSEYQREYDEAHAAWRSLLWHRVEEAKEAAEDPDAVNAFDIYAATKMAIPSGTVPREKSAGDCAQTAIYVLSRNAGEGADRCNAPGDYLLTEEETAQIHAICRLYEHVVLVLNTGGLVDLAFTDAPQCANVDAILYIHQPGMEAGNAFADVLSGAVNPSARLTDTWAFSYSDYPNAADFSHNSGDVTREEYVEGLYVGYRYFDTFEIPVRYCFGYGLSYTKFAIQQIGVAHYDLGTDHPQIGLRVRVMNTGAAAGREVVQVYVSCPQEGQEKEFRRLTAYKKTAMLAPGASQELEICFPLESLAVYDEVLPGWVIEAGQYIVMFGDSLQNAEPAAVVTVQQDLVVSRTQNICPLQETLEDLSRDEETFARTEVRRKALLAAAWKENRPEITLHEGDITGTVFRYGGAYDTAPQDARNFVDTLTTGQLLLLTSGDIRQGLSALQIHEEEPQEAASQLGSAGTLVPGSAAQTSDCAAQQGLPAIVLADGPAGLRLNRSYQVINGVPAPASFMGAIEGGYLVEGRPEAQQKGVSYYQFCTAFPTGTQLAQSWDTALLQEVGAAVGEEMKEFGVTLWLAPGMNIHRNPLCGRNFEYYSEDPVVSGLCAAAVTSGVQSEKGVGTTIKHFACNNQEDNRMGSNSILSERVLREIYLKGFEIAVRQSQPMSIMTSYNLINGVHAANNYDLCTLVARCEWGFQGVIMTDWTTTLVDDTCTASGCMRAGNDLVMPGAPMDLENLQKELDEGTLDLRDVKRSVSRLVNIVRQSCYYVKEE